MIQNALIAAVVALAIVAGVTRAGDGLDTTFCKIHQALAAHVVCAHDQAAR